jgi:hypothetical protein
MIIRITAREKSTSARRYPDGEISWDSPLSKAMEETITFQGSELSSFMEDWDKFIFQTNVSPRKDFSEKWELKAENLRAVLFGKTELPWRDLEFSQALSFRTDPEYTNLPLEILPGSEKSLLEREAITRSIRGVQNPDLNQGKVSQNFLFLKNPIEENLIASTEREADLIESIYFDHFKNGFVLLADLKLAKFWEEISQARFVHYAGHTQKEGIPFPKEDSFLLNGITEKSLHSIEILFLNSCDSASENHSIPSLVRCFLQAGVQNVLGFINPVSTDHAEVAAVTFWNEYFTSKDILKSHHKAKLALLKLGEVGRISALSLVCFASETKRDFSRFPKSALQFLVISAVCLFILSFLVNQDQFQCSAPVSSAEVELAYSHYLKEPKPNSLLEDSDYRKGTPHVAFMEEQEKDFNFYLSQCRVEVARDYLKFLFFLSPTQALLQLQNCNSNPNQRITESVIQSLDRYSRITELYVPKDWMEDPELKDLALRAMAEWRDFLIRFSNLAQKQDSERFESAIRITDELRIIFLEKSPNYRKLDYLKKWSQDWEAEKKSLFYFSSISPVNPWGEITLLAENQKSKQFFLEILNHWDSYGASLSKSENERARLANCLKDFPLDSKSRYRLLFWIGFFKDYDFRPIGEESDSLLFRLAQSQFENPLFSQRLRQVTNECESSKK